MGKDIFSIKGKIIIITGGLGQLGRQYCYELLQREAKVVILDLPQNPSEEFLKKCKTIHKDNVLYFSLNLTQKGIPCQLTALIVPRFLCRDRFVFCPNYFLLKKNISEEYNNTMLCKKNDEIRYK